MRELPPELPAAAWAAAARELHRELSGRMKSPDPAVRKAAFEGMSELVAEAIERVRAAADGGDYMPCGAGTR